MKEQARSVLSGINLFNSTVDELAKGEARQGLLNMLAALDGEATTAEERDFASFCLGRYHRSYAQLQQDLFVLWRSKGKQGGTFVEFGASNGVTNSNSLMLERDYGWGGLLIEALPWHRRDIVRARPDAELVIGAVDPTYPAAPKSLEIMASAGHLSSLVGFAENDEHATRRKQTGAKIKVPAINLHDALRSTFGNHRIDFMSIDVEGPELAILQGFDFMEFPVGCLCVEVNDREQDRAEITSLMSERGYTTVFGQRITRNDLWFVRRDELAS
jgi:hypothetical protein